MVYSGHDYSASIGSFATVSSAYNAWAVVGLGPDFQIMAVELNGGSVSVKHSGKLIGGDFPEIEWNNDVLLKTDHGYLAGMTRSMRGNNYHVIEGCVLLLV